MTQPAYVIARTRDGRTEYAAPADDGDGWGWVADAADADRYGIARAT